MLSTEQLDDLRERGIVRLGAVVDEGTAAAMEDQVWSFLAGTAATVRDDPSTWPTGLVSGLQPLRKAGVFDAFAGDAVATLADELLGPGGWSSMTKRPTVQPLVTFPSKVEWTVPHKVWHFDLPARGAIDRLAALRLIGFVNHVVPRGGGTLVVEGAHELVRRLVDESATADAGGSADVRKALARCYPFFADLARPGGDRVERFMGEGEQVEGVHLVVRELTGTPGELVLMHPWTFHNLSPNVADRPRMMVSHTVYALDQPFWSAGAAIQRNGAGRS